MMSLASKGGLICRKLLALGDFFGQQCQQHFVPILVTFRIALALRDQMPVVRNVGVVDVVLHCSLSRDVSFTSIMARGGKLK
jgi:hypothetical protein